MIIQKDNLTGIIEGYLKNKILIIPTDTIYGLTCSIRAQEAKIRIFQLKGRSERVYLSVIVSSLRMAKKLATINQTVKKLLKQKIQITVILNINKEINQRYGITDDDTIGIRITKSKWLKKIIKKVGPIYATSVNITGANYGKELKEFSNFNADLIIDGGYLDNGPSRVYDSLKNEYVR